MRYMVMVISTALLMSSCNSITGPDSSDLEFFDLKGQVKEVYTENQTVFGGHEETILYRYQNPRFNIDWGSGKLVFNNKGQLIHVSPSSASYMSKLTKPLIIRYEDSIIIKLKSNTQLFV